MYVRCLRACDGVTHVMRSGRVYEVSPNVGRHLVDQGLCQETTAELYLAQLVPVREREKRPEARKLVETR